MEGVTEVRTIQQFLRKLKKDHRILLLPLGGSQFICGGRDGELEDIRRITTSVSVLIDSERTSEQTALDKGRAAFVETCTKLKFPCHVSRTPCH